MDPLSALSLAGTLIQFVDFSSKLFSGAKSLYKSANGALAVHDELELIVSDSNSVLSKLHAYAQSPHHSVGESEAVAQDAQDDFKNVCDEATRLAAELTERLQGLKVDRRAEGYRRMWASLSHAINSAWSHKEIIALQQRLKDLKNALQTRVLLSLRFLHPLLLVWILDLFDVGRISICFRHKYPKDLTPWMSRREISFPFLWKTKESPPTES
jgi:hypothetical protein